MSKEIQINYSIKEISIIENSLKPANLSSDVKKPIEYNFDLGLGLKIEKDTKSIIIDIHDKIWVNNKSKRVDLGTLSTRIEFSIRNFDDLSAKKNKVSLPPPFLSILIGFALSTHRGVLFTLAMGTLMNGIIFPIIDPLPLTDGVLNLANKDSET